MKPMEKEKPILVCHFCKEETLHKKEEKIGIGEKTLIYTCSICDATLKQVIHNRVG